MPTYISILRGINVSGQKMIKMDNLRKLYEGLNFKNVRTYIQSGNVIFDFKKSSAKVLENLIQKKISGKFGFQVPVMVKNRDEIINVLENNPFVSKRKEDITKLHVTFLSDEPDEVSINKIEKEKFKPDEFIVSSSTVYLFCPNGYGRTKLTNNFFENKFHVVATTRNWKTVNELNRLAEE